MIRNVNIRTLVFNEWLDFSLITSCGRVYQQTVGIPMCTNCAALVVDVFLYYYEADFVHLQKSKFKKQNKII